MTSERENMPRIVAIYGSPRRNGNTSALLRQSVRGAVEAGATVTEFVLRDLKMSPCLEIYACKESGLCSIKDDFGTVRDHLTAAKGVMIASPIFFYTVSAQIKILMDSCQSLWVKKYWIDKIPFRQWTATRKGLFISAGATSGKKLFDGALMSMKYFFDVLDTELWRSLLYRGLDFEGDVHRFPAYLDEAYQAGRQLVDALQEGWQNIDATGVAEFS
jgi:multimeric flavodoxin WrbA